MIKIENVEVLGWEHAIRGMRNPKNSWERSDSRECVSSCDDCDNFSVCNPNFDPYFRRFWEGSPINCNYAIGPNDHKLMMQLADGGPVHAKYRRMITVYLDITAPLYFWKEFDTYKVGTVANSCSTMHKIADKEFEIWDFSFEKLIGKIDDNWDIAAGPECRSTPLDILEDVIYALNVYRDKYLEVKTKPMKDNSKREELMKKYWWQMIQLLPSSYNQKRTVMLNYEVLHNMYIWRKDHKLDEWREFCKWIETLPYSELIIGEESESLKYLKAGEAVAAGIKAGLESCSDNIPRGYVRTQEEIARDQKEMRDRALKILNDYGIDFGDDRDMTDGGRNET